MINKQGVKRASTLKWRIIKRGEGSFEPAKWAEQGNSRPRRALTSPFLSPGDVLDPGATMWSSERGWVGSMAARHHPQQDWSKQARDRTFVGNALSVNPRDSNSHIYRIRRGEEASERANSMAVQPSGIGMAGAKQINEQGARRLYRTSSLCFHTIKHQIMKLCIPSGMSQVPREVAHTCSDPLCVLRSTAGQIDSLARKAANSVQNQIQGCKFKYR